MDAAEIDTRFTYHTPKDGQPAKYTELRDRAKELAVLINDLCPESREKASAFTKLEESMFWANASLARRGE